MKSKAPLALIEQTIMILIFSLAAVLCLRAFAYAETRSTYIANCAQASVRAENAAETLKHCRGDYDRAAQLCGGVWDGSAWSIAYDENWQETGEQPTYLLPVWAAESENHYLGSACVTVAEADGEELLSLPVSWQEVSADE